MELLRILMLSMLYHLIYAYTCYNIYSGDTYQYSHDSYCLPIIKWPISDTSLLFASQYDAIAYANYQTLLNNYYKTSLVNLDCLGMSKYFFCAAAYPTCNSTDSSFTDDIVSVCSWMCELFSVRCGEDNQFYQKMCVNGVVSDTYCSGEVGLKTYWIFCVLLLLIKIGAQG